MDPRQRKEYSSPIVFLTYSIVGRGEAMEAMWNARSRLSRPSEENVQKGCIVCSSRQGMTIQHTGLRFILKLKIKRNDWLLANMCPQAPNHCALF